MCGLISAAVLYRVGQNYRPQHNFFCQGCMLENSDVKAKLASGLEGQGHETLSLRYPGQLSFLSLRGRKMSISYSWKGKGVYGSFRLRRTCGVQVKLWDPLKTRAIEHLISESVRTFTFIL